MDCFRQIMIEMLTELSARFGLNDMLCFLLRNAFTRVLFFSDHDCISYQGNRLLARDRLIHLGQEPIRNRGNLDSVHSTANVFGRGARESVYVEADTHSFFDTKKSNESDPGQKSTCHETSKISVQKKLRMRV